MMAALPFSLYDFADSPQAQSKTQSSARNKNHHQCRRRYNHNQSLAPIPENDGELEEDDEDSVELEDDLEEKEVRAGEEHEYRGKQAIEVEVPIEHKTEIENITPNREGKSSEQESVGWEAIPKPKRHSQLGIQWEAIPL